MPSRKLPPIHPGEILREEFLGPFGISQYRLAKETSVSPRRINSLVTRQSGPPRSWVSQRGFPKNSLY